MIAAAAAATSPRARRWAIGALLVGGIFYLTVLFPKLLEFSRLFGPHAGTVMTQEQVLNAHHASLSLPDSRPRPVPRIIHQAYLDEQSPGNRTIPQELATSHWTCESTHPTWEYKLWHSDEARAFIKSEFPSFLAIYDGFKSAQQRSDALRYFLVRHFGGIYIDLHIHCDASLEPLLFYPAWVAYSGEGPLSNDIIAGEPGHPFWLLMTTTESDPGPFKAKTPAAPPHVGPHVAMGPWYETQKWERYHAEKPSDSPDLMLLLAGEDKAATPGVFFHVGEGLRERKGSHAVVQWAGRHPYQITFLGFAVACAAVFTYLSLGQTVLEYRTTNKGYRVLEYLPTTWRSRAHVG
ncbi:hypothetical protein JDV02_004338 [Purpureocillium takamizusanense]|uniref:Mannosyl phosphorylinositol ceramide synthase SUR1 n=1 Tax=Purpureocillium takamizusanense TaxID=2060973 RepID=A0A9Q8QF29_9HYPO|nr:uncharacterized protein JDV02_004338 [Purpureocillium takamizusanense]UNI18041.1 hypothetical protein JDV02_004338 [Purpureocillium takamizusanense]